MRCVVTCLFALASGSALASTAAFQGRVVEVGECPSNDNGKDCLRTFTVRISYFDYVSWNKFGRHSQVGETITRRVRTRGTVGVLDGELTNARTIAKAFRPETWGYFYEDTWLNLRTMPDFVWGEFVKHDPAKRTITLRLHRTHKDHHIASNPPRDREIAYDEKTAFRFEDEIATPATALVPGAWLQVHEPRSAYWLVRTKDAAYEATEQLPVERGQRGFANDLTRSATLSRIQSKTSDGVIDVSATLTVTNAAGEPETLNCNKTSFVLDGKLAPVRIANRAGRRVVLCHYRRETKPHKVFVESRDDALRGRITAVTDDAITVAVTDANGRTESITVPIDPTASLHVDGLPSTAESLRVGHTITVHPARGRTIVSFVGQE